jgi:hypothetical protein
MRFEFVRSFISPLLALLRLGRRHTWIEVTDEVLEVRMGWAFRLRARLEQVASAEVVQEPVPLRLGVGVHVWGREWAVNTARRPHVVIRFTSPQRATTLLIPLRVHTLHVSPENPEAVVYALSLSGRGVPDRPL